MENAQQIVMTTCPDEPVAEEMARYLIENRLAACVSLVPQVRSIYRWNDRVDSAREVLLLIKTRRDAYPALQDAIRARHPYQLPEIVAFPLSAGLPAYLAWIDDQVTA